MESVINRNIIYNVNLYFKIFIRRKSFFVDITIINEKETLFCCKIAELWYNNAKRKMNGGS